MAQYDDYWFNTTGMENWDGSNEERKRYETFKAATRERVSHLGTQRGSSVRSAQAVTRRLFEITEGDAGKVTDQMIIDAYDEADGTN